jgi:hypothetical protein
VPFIDRLDAETLRTTISISPDQDQTIKIKLFVVIGIFGALRTISPVCLTHYIIAGPFALGRAYLFLQSDQRFAGADEGAATVSYQPARTGLTAAPTLDNRRGESP